MFREKTSLVLGRGEVYFNRLDTSVQDSERYFGNTPMFRIEREIRRVERMTAYRGQRQARPGIVVQETVSGSLTTDNMVTDNIALWHGAQVAVEVDGDALVPYTETFVVKKNRFYQLGMSENAVGLAYIDSIEVRLTNSTGTPLIAGIHYHLDRSTGRIQIPPTSPLADMVTIWTRYLKRPSPLSVMLPTGHDVFGAMRYIDTNPYGPRLDYWFPQVRLTPRGAVDMKGDEFRQMSFDIEAIRLSPVQPLFYAVVDKNAPIPITADTAMLRADTTLYRADNGAWENEV